MSSPVVVYRERLKERQARVTAAEQRYGQLANLRLLLFVGGFGLAIASWGFALLTPLSLAVPALLFVVSVIWHERVARQKAHAELAAAHVEAGLARLEHRWAGQGLSGERLMPSEHPYAADLDLVGEGSLFELLCQARTRAGERTLAHWLSCPEHPLPGEEIELTDRLASRVAAVQELREGLDLREALALAGAGLRAEVEPEALCQWGERPIWSPSMTAYALAWLPTLAAPLLLGLAVAGLLPWTPFILVAVAELVVYRFTARRLALLTGQVDSAGRQLVVLSQVLQILEAERFEAPRLRELAGRLTVSGRQASVAISSLDRRLSWLEAMKNAFFAPLGLITLWPLHWTLAIERWRAQAGSELRAWLDTLGELEALSSLAGYAYEHPADPFAEIEPLTATTREGHAPRLHGEALAHPLLPSCVPNDIDLGGDDGAVWMISGSNMSGKSTYLRTVGINIVLALAGAPVHARRLSLTPLALGATLRIQDSLHEGRSRFFAEVRRLKQLADLARGELPLCFLLDELLAGTNSHDRQVGARALLARFSEAGALGLVTTHDLALGGKEAGGEPTPWLRDKHFTDALVEARKGRSSDPSVEPLDEDPEQALSFDYLLRDGPLQGSNALALMRAVGLDV